MTAVGIPTPPANAKLTYAGFLRYGINGCYYLKRLGADAAIFGDWRTGESHKWFKNSCALLDGKQLPKHRATIKELDKLQKQEKERQYAYAAAACSRTWWYCMTVKGSSQYLARKQVAAFGLRYSNDSVVIPLRDVAGKLWSFQYIHANGTKIFSKGGKTRGCFHTIGEICEIDDTVFIGEGYATMASIYMATGVTCVVAFNAGNLEPVIEVLRRQFPRLAITIAADDDRWKPHIGNIGRIKAIEAAKRFGCAVALPWFKDSASEPTDWNDLHVLEGLDEVKSQLAGVLDASR
jgi:putative DNA primase/helicase